MLEKGQLHKGGHASNVRDIKYRTAGLKSQIFLKIS